MFTWCQNNFLENQNPNQSKLVHFMYPAAGRHPKMTLWQKFLGVSHYKKHFLGENDLSVFLRPIKTSCSPWISFIHLLIYFAFHLWYEEPLLSRYSKSKNGKHGIWLQSQQKMSTAFTVFWLFIPHNRNSSQIMIEGSLGLSLDDFFIKHLTVIHNSCFHNQSLLTLWLHSFVT